MKCLRRGIELTKRVPRMNSAIAQWAPMRQIKSRSGFVSLSLRGICKTALTTKIQRNLACWAWRGHDDEAITYGKPPQENVHARTRTSPEEFQDRDVDRTAHACLAFACLCQ